MPGLFLCLEGIDGCGKSTQIGLLTSWLESLGHQICCTREPGGTQLGEALRNILLHQIDTPQCMMSEMLLYMASRAQLMEEVVNPALASGKVVIADRFLLSNVVYQGSAGGLNPEEIWHVGRLATGGKQPHLTLLLDLEPAEAMARLTSEPDRLESRGMAYMQEVREGYLFEGNKLEAGTFEIVDATRPPEEMHEHIKKAVTAKLAGITG